ncbi:hypothetical protein A2U01_0025663, partial [Trifolium medium]|nr:hypothetical protein [Trifolium medium]
EGGGLGAGTVLMVLVAVVVGVEMGWWWWLELMRGVAVVRCWGVVVVTKGVVVWCCLIRI